MFVKNIGKVQAPLNSAYIEMAVCLKTLWVNLSPINRPRWPHYWERCHAHKA